MQKTYCDGCGAELKKNVQNSIVAAVYVFGEIEVELRTSFKGSPSAEICRRCAIEVVEKGEIKS